MRITRKLLIPTLIVFSLIIAGLIAYNAITSQQEFDAAEEARMETMSEVFNARLNSKADMALALASEVANNPEVQAAFADKDRERLTELTLPSYQAIKDQFDLPQFQFHLPPAISFLRLHSLDKYGDDLSSFRFTVLTANAEKRPVSGPELGRAGLGVRGVVPVTYQGRHIGTVEFGSDISSALIEELKSEFGYDIQILLSRAPAEVATFTGVTGESQGPTDDLLLQASTLNTPVFASANNYVQTLAGNSQVEHVGVDDLEYAIYTTPLYDYSGNIIGVVDIISDHTVIAQQQNTKVISSAVVLLAILLVSSFAFAYFARRILNPISDLTSVAGIIAGGDFSKRTNIKSNDELGTLAQTFDSMAAQLQDIFGTLEQRVANRTKALETSAEVSRRLTSILDPNELAGAVVNQIQTAFNYYYAQVYLFDETGENLVLTAGTGEAGAEMMKRGHKLSKGRGLVGRAAESNQSVLVSNTSQDPNWLPNDLLPETKTETSIPIAIGDRVLGVLDVQGNVVNEIDSADITLLESLAGQVAISLQNARIYAQVEQERRQNALVLETAGEGIFGLDVEGNHTFVNPSGAKMLGYSTEELIGKHSHSMWHHTHADGTPFPGEECPIYYTLHLGTVNQGEEYFIRKDGTGFYVSFTSQPIIEEGKVIGAVVTFADITQQKLDREMTALRARQQEVINMITQKIQSTTTIEGAMQITARELGHALGNRQTLVTLDPSALDGNGKANVTE